MEKEFGSEEPKQETTGKEFYESADKVITVERQETLEEAFKKTYLGQRLFFDSNEGKSFEEGAKWQAERMYSDEEVVELLYKRDLYLLNRDEEVELELPNEWFEQLKKK
jgi:hypothetical protein